MLPISHAYREVFNLTFHGRNPTTTHSDYYRLLPTTSFIVTVVLDLHLFCSPIIQGLFITSMPDIFLTPPKIQHAEEMLAFEIENRSFFETTVTSRPDGYYTFDGIRSSIENAIRDALDDNAYQYLVRDKLSRLVGRANLTRVRRAHFHSAEIGYRIAQSECGRGYASGAVRLLVSKAFDELNLVRVEANARSTNMASCRVLERNQFRPFGRSAKSFELGGVWHDVIHWDRRTSM